MKKRAGARLSGLTRRAVVVMALVLSAPAVVAGVHSDQPAAVLVVPKLIVDTARGIDTLVRISNASATPVMAQCFYVNATPECVDGEGNCVVGQRFASLSCTGTCEERWQETDFRIVLTQNQPVAWMVSKGAVDCRSTELGEDLIPDNNAPCFPLDGIFRSGAGGQSNAGSRVPPVAQDPFIGELKCVAVDENDQPVERNVLYGNVTIVEARAPKKNPIDVSTYNAIGIQAVLGTNNGDRTLVLGREGDPGVEYDGCPNLLILDHFFDFATDPAVGGAVTTDLTLVPCTEDFLRQDTVRTPVQFLVFNEFEQRFSTSRHVECFRNIQISNIDTRTNTRSIFSAQVAGTLTGQTRIRGVPDDDVDHGHTILGVVEEFRPTGTAAFNLHRQGIRPQRDFVYLP